MSVFEGIAHSMNDDAKGLQEAIEQLQKSLSSIAPMWQDEKYLDLVNAIRTLADDSVELLKTGEQCSTTMQKLDSLITEGY